MQQQNSKDDNNEENQEEKLYLQCIFTEDGKNWP